MAKSNNSPWGKPAQKALQRHLQQQASGPWGRPAKEALARWLKTHPGTPNINSPFITGQYGDAPQQPPASGGAQAPAADAPAPPIAPFLNADDMAALASFNKELADKLREIDSSLVDLKAQTDYDKTATNQQAKEVTGEAKDAMIARGLFQSSIKDAAVFDIEAKRALQQKFLDDRLTRANLDADTQKTGLRNWQTEFLKAQDRKMVENAAAITPVVKDAPETPAPPATPAPQAPAPGGGTIHGGTAAPPKIKSPFVTGKKPAGYTNPRPRPPKINSPFVAGGKRPSSGAQAAAAYSRRGAGQ